MWKEGSRCIAYSSSVSSSLAVKCIICLPLDSCGSQEGYLLCGKRVGQPLYALNCTNHGDSKARLKNPSECSSTKTGYVSLKIYTYRTLTWHRIMLLSYYTSALRGSEIHLHVLPLTRCTAECSARSSEQTAIMTTLATPVVEALRVGEHSTIRICGPSPVTSSIASDWRTSAAEP